MQLYLLSGNSVKTKPWIQEVRDKLAPMASGAEVQWYRHWTTGHRNIYFDEEVAKAQRELANPLVSHCVFAKSAGVAVTLAATNEETLPEACVFVGVPLSMLSEHNLDFAAWCRQWQIPTLCIQQTNDPLGSLNELSDEIGDAIPSVEIVEVAGDDHWYGDTDHLANLVDPFIDRVMRD